MRANSDVSKLRWATLSAVVGVLCRDGVVVGTDSSCTFTTGVGPPTIEQPTEKLKICSDAVIIAGTGQFGLGQRFGFIVETAYNEKLFARGPHFTSIGTELCKRAWTDFGSTGVQIEPVWGTDWFFICRQAVSLRVCRLGFPA